MDKETEDLYVRFKTLQRQLEFIEIQEEYVKDETKNLKRELLRAQEEVKRIQSVPLVIGQFLEMIDANHGVVSSTAGSHYYVRVSALPMGLNFFVTCCACILFVPCGTLRFSKTISCGTLLRCWVQNWVGN